jgi:hypothetical protein
MTLRLVPKDQVPNAEFPKVKFACDIRPTRCGLCSLATCEYGMVPGLREKPEPKKDGPGAA